MKFRTAAYDDHQKIKELYQRVAAVPGGIAREASEITDEYVDTFLRNSIEHGLIIVAEHPEDNTRIIAEIHGYKSSIKIFQHVISQVTIVVDPAFQGKKLGKTIFTIFQEEIAVNHRDIGRVELFTRESNAKALKFYQSIGFVIEGRFEMRIKNSDGTYEADIPMAWQNPNFDFD